MTDKNDPTEVDPRVKDAQTDSLVERLAAKWSDVPWAAGSPEVPLSKDARWWLNEIMGELDAEADRRYEADVEDETGFHFGFVISWLRSQADDE